MPDPRGREPSVRDEQARQRRDSPRQSDRPHTTAATSTRGHRALRPSAGRHSATRRRAQKPDIAGDADQNLLRHLAADGAHQHQTADQRADDRADGIGRVNTADEPARILTCRARPRRAPAESLRPTAASTGSITQTARIRSS